MGLAAESREAMVPWYVTQKGRGNCGKPALPLPLPWGAEAHTAAAETVGAQRVQV